MRRIDIGKRFGRLVVIAQGSSHLVCRCDCGICFASIPGNVRSGKVSSCGCYRRDNTASMKTTHGLRHTVEYHTWQAIINRCENPLSQDFKNYGGRGIKVCSRWREDFGAFYRDMGRRPLGHSIERIENDKDYEPTNCKWATRIEQNRNKRNSRRFEFDGVSLTIGGWADVLNISAGTLSSRIRLYKWPIHRALTEGVHRHAN